MMLRYNLTVCICIQEASLGSNLAPKARVWQKQSEGPASGCTAKGRKKQALRVEW